MSEKYVSTTMAMDLNIASLEEAARLIGPAATFELHVCENNIIWVRQMLKKLACDVMENPFAPYVNLILDNQLGQFEWFLSANGRSIGSPGL